MNPDVIAKKVMLVILDGVGAAPDNRGNAVTQAAPPNLTKYWDSYPHTYIQASGEAVGLPSDVYGNSEVGHLNIGAGRTILQNLPKINKSIETGRYYTNNTLSEAFHHAVQNHSRIHLLGCFSDGSVHAHIDHFIATLKFFKKKGFEGKIYIHAFTDGRDTLPNVAKQYFLKMQKEIDILQIGHIATIIGRAFSMDRNQKWERSQKAYDLVTQGRGSSFPNWQEALAAAYTKGQSDEYFEPMIIPDNQVLPIIQNNDVVLFMNYRADRALQLTDALIDPSFKGFQIKPLNNLFFAAMVPYRRNYPEKQIFPKEYIKLSLGRVLAERGLRQLRIAESEKFPHVTYFFNGGLPIKYNGEDRIEIRSPNVPTYDLKPEMSAYEIRDSLLMRFNLDIYSFILVNFANPDMVGHTGNLSACVKAVQVVDEILGDIVPAFIAKGGTVIITADHGNAEEVIKVDTGDVDTEHSFNPVPLIIINKELRNKNLKYGSLSDIAPTILDLMGINKPTEMQGNSLIVR
jgi:2,3-bisphosphoglycerate-independent phosphoglycerate mutase